MSDKTRDCVARPAKVKLGQLYTLGELERLGLVTLGRGKVISKIDIANTPGNNPVYSSSAMGNGEIGRYGKYMFEDERITWSVDGGGRLFYREPHKYSVTNVCGWLKVNAPDIDTKFLYLLLTSRWGRMTFDYTYKAHPSVIREAYRDLSFPSLSDQHRLTAKIDQIVALIKVRELQLSKFDELVKSRFVEMFGDGSLSDEKQLFSEICEFVTVGIANSATHAYAESGVPMLRNQNIREGSLDDSDLVYIKSEFAEKYRSKTLKENDLLIVRTGYPGVSCVVPKKYEGAQTFTTLIARLRDLDETDPVFVCHYLNSPYGKEYVDKSKVGIAQQNFGARALEGMPIFIPHISLQREFAAFVAEVDKSEFAVRKSLEELQKLYRQQLQEAFG